MNANILEFLKKLNQNPEVTAKLSATRDPDEAYKLASSLQDGFTQEEFESAMKDLAAAAEAGEISDADLEKIAGGGTSELVLSAGVSLAVSTTAAAGAAI